MDGARQQKKVVIIGAGPAGLTAAYELLTRLPGVKVVVYEASADLGGISKTVNYRGNRMDMGGHRFFSKSDRVMEWWQKIMPLATELRTAEGLAINYHNQTKVFKPLDLPLVANEEAVMLVRQRLSRIFFLGKFFDYPVALNWNTVSNLGLVRMIKIGWSYLLARLVPIKPEKSLEDFLINRFGRELYKTFFKDYTEKVWGMACAQISAEWGAQRIKGLSISRALLNIIKSWRVKTDDLKQKQVETSLIQKFLYPKLGPGQMWQEVAKKIEALGGEIHLNHEVVALAGEASSKIEAVSVRDSRTGEVKEVRGDYFFSTMPVQELIAKLTPLAPEIVRQVAQGLMYRDFVTVGLLMDKMKLGDNQTGRLKDNWIYIQEPQVKLGRLQIFNNWSPYLVADQATTWLGLEYFCTEGDELWTKSDEQFMADAVEELVTIGMIDSSDVIDRTIVRVKKAYPAYFGSYGQFAVIREFTDGITNLFLIGRNGMHKYNNQDHSMLTAMRAVDNIIEGIESKANIWSINAEQEYHEQKSS